MAKKKDIESKSEQKGNGEDTTPQVGILSQYVKDFSFENPNSPAVYQWDEQPRFNVEFSIGAQKITDDVHEVALKIDITAASDKGAVYKADLLYAGLFALRNIPEEQLQPFLLAEAPRILFPFARRIIADIVQESGFPPMLLDPIDFGALYMQRAALAQAEASDGQASEVTGQA